MKFLLLATLAGAALAVPADLSSRQTCSSPRLRKSWSKATNAEKQSYINAVLCLATKPSKLKVSTHKTLYDDFGYVHAALAYPTNKIHENPNFLPWHRYFVHVYEKALQDCGYAGTAMYWDWVADSSAPTKAAVFNPVLGFGGNGNGTADNGGHPRVRDGAFTSLRPTYWGTTVEPHWLSRDWQSSDGTPGVPPDMYSNAWNPEAMEYVNSQTLYDEFRRALESSPHASVHAGVGGPRGDMGLHDASPNDPLFFLHHAQVDRLWWIWQQQSPSTRTTAYEGTGIDGNPVTRKDLLPMLGLAADRAVEDFLNVRGGFLCYTY